MASPNLDITEVTPGQDGKVNRINQARDNLELAVTNPVDIDNDTATATLTTTEAGEALGNLFYRFIGTPGSLQTVNVPANTKLYAIENALTDDNDLLVQVTGGGGASITVPVGYRILLYVDGAGDVIALGSPALASGGAGAFVSNVTFSSSATTPHASLPLLLDVASGITTAFTPDIGHPVNRAGSLLGGAIMIECSTFTAAGAVELNVYVNGVVVFTGTTTISAAGTFTVTSNEGPGIDVLAAGDILGFEIDLAPASTFQGSIRNLVGYVEMAQEI